jgi:hypothetical protein
MLERLRSQRTREAQHLRSVDFTIRTNPRRHMYFQCLLTEIEVPMNLIGLLVSIYIGLSCLFFLFSNPICPMTFFCLVIQSVLCLVIQWHSILSNFGQYRCNDSPLSISLARTGPSPSTSIAYRSDRRPEAAKGCKKEHEVLSSVATNAAEHCC